MSKVRAMRCDVRCDKLSINFEWYSRSTNIISTSFTSINFWTSRRVQNKKEFSQICTALMDGCHSVTFFCCSPFLPYQVAMLLSHVIHKSAIHSITQTVHHRWHRQPHRELYGWTSSRGRKEEEKKEELIIHILWQSSFERNARELCMLLIDAGLRMKINSLSIIFLWCAYLLSVKVTRQMVIFMWFANNTLCLDIRK